MVHDLLHPDISQLCNRYILTLRFGRPHGGHPAAVLKKDALTRPCPAMPRRGPEAGNTHRIIYDGKNRN